ncbi:uncharacterized protein M421DRAFT_227749 [Didymella exigua CBS 183.55]|uniref:Uncharacterized protein n=1 Tax=Didymella exigua CBS 183.55 TaxID=1150837 RepID=A0A6A5RFI2_9PLEO|nr:uncharacterized protein M421DRAFT_227749 [Didymella exigua CBS 183.55]KAF1925938.1 hypothetical protein M421DRAFT_227749 [Didymella exigua CBS 183.55]
MDSQNTAASSEPVSVPADHQDPNHPHCPRDLEHQSGTHRSALLKKRVLFAGGVVTTVFVIIATAILGVALTRKHDDKPMDAPIFTMAANATISAPVEVHTVSVNATTTVYSTTRMPLLVALSLATSTIVLAVPQTLDAPLRPVAAETIFAAPTPSVSAHSEAPVGDISITECFFSGAWALKEQCVKHCPARNDHEMRCEISKRTQWVCVPCPSES